MKIIDLTLEISKDLLAYPGDPEVEIEQVFVAEKDDWNVKRIHLNTHDGTHVNVSNHISSNGKTIEKYPLDRFCGNCILYENNNDIKENIGLIFTKEKDLTMNLAQILVNKKVKFIGLSFDFDLDIERFLIEHDMITFENLTNVDKLPKEFEFYGIPMKIKEGDGSPIRAFAIIR